jgi:DNA-binding response OmpR family regulator
MYFVENQGIVLSANQILGYLWDYDDKFVDANTLTVYIRRLRTKVEDDPSNPKYILTVRGRGYKWSEGAES